MNVTIIAALCSVTAIVAVNAYRLHESGPETQTVSIQRDAGAACAANEVWWFATDDAAERTCIDVDAVVQDVIKVRCQEDEAFTWVANDERGCVNMDELVGR